MIIKTHYKSSLDKNIGRNKKNILSFRSDIKNEELPITQLGWGFIWLLIKHKFKHKVYMIVIPGKNSLFYDFIYLKNKK